MSAVFVDTNVLVYDQDTSEPEKQARAHSWLVHLWSTRSGHLSFQVLSEFYVTVTQKLRPGMTVARAQRIVHSLLAWRPLSLNQGLLTRAFAVQDEHQLAWWDAQIVAAAQLAGCRILLTEDLQDGQKLGEVMVVSPFRHAPKQ